MGIAPVIGISIPKMPLFLEARVEEHPNSVLHTLAASIDARDDLTAGDSGKRSTGYAFLGICSESEGFEWNIAKKW